MRLARLAARLEARRTASAARARGDHDHADAAIEGAQHLVLGDAAGRCASQRNTGGTSMRVEIEPGAERLRQHARNVVGEAAAGDMGQRLDPPCVCAIAPRSGFT